MFEALPLPLDWPVYVSHAEASAYAAWKGKAQSTVDNAHMRYFIVHLHRLLDPEATA